MLRFACWISELSLRGLRMGMTDWEHKSHLKGGQGQRHAGNEGKIPQISGACTSVRSFQLQF